MQKETKDMAKLDAIEKCMYGIIWWLGSTNWTPELDEKVRSEVSQLYDAAFKDGQEFEEKFGKR